MKDSDQANEVASKLMAGVLKRVALLDEEAEYLHLMLQLANQYGYIAGVGWAKEQI